MQLTNHQCVFIFAHEFVSFNEILKLNSAKIINARCLRLSLTLKTCLNIWWKVSLPIFNFENVSLVLRAAPIRMNVAMWVSHHADHTTLETVSRLGCLTPCGPVGQPWPLAPTVMSPTWTYTLVDGWPTARVVTEVALLVRLMMINIWWVTQSTMCVGGRGLTLGGTITVI